MNKRFPAIGTAFVLLALAILLFRPVMLDAIGSPYGSYYSPDVQILHADDSPHCALLADCETVSISNVGLVYATTVSLLILAGLVMAVAPIRTRVLHSWTVPVPNPPPLFALS